MTAAALALMALIACPDCGREVSRRAVSCPGCGCPGAAIAERAKELEKRKEPDAYAIAHGGAEEFRALPVMMDGAGYLVMPLEHTFGMETLNFTMASKGGTLEYGAPEVALEVPLVRFRIGETNFVFAAADTNVATRLADAPAVPARAGGWLAMRPAAFRKQGRILKDIEAGKEARLPKNAHPTYLRLEARLKAKGNGK